jgi:hypothetical protein
MACTSRRTRVVDNIATGLSSQNGVTSTRGPRRKSRGAGLVDPLPRLAGMVVTDVVDVAEAGEMAREFAHGLARRAYGLDRKAVPKA